MKIVKHYLSPDAAKTKRFNIVTKALGTDFAVTEGERAVVATISTESIDRDGEIMRAAGARTANYEKNPCVLYNHDYQALPVARCVSLSKNAGKGLRAKMIFPTRPADHSGDWQPDICFSLIQQGSLNAFSIGFAPIRGHYPTQDEQNRYGPKLRYIHDEWDLLEFSIVTVPANQDAVVEAVSKATTRKAVVYLIDRPQQPTPPKRVIVVQR